MTKTYRAYISGFARGITEAISDQAFHGPSSMTARLLSKAAHRRQTSSFFIRIRMPVRRRHRQAEN